MGSLFSMFGGLANPLKFQIVGLLLAALLLTNGINWFVTSRIYYAKGVNVSKVAVEKYQKQVLDLQLKVNKASGEVATKVVTQYRDRIIQNDKIVYKNGQVITKYVPNPTDPTGKMINVPAGWVYAHDQAAKGLEIDPAKASVTTPTTVTYSQALQIVSENYGTFYNLVAQVKGWQNYYAGLQQVYVNYKKTEIKTNGNK